LVVVGLTAVRAGAQTYDAVSDFNGSTNPSGAWSYLYTPTVGGPGVPLTLATNLAGTGIPFFWDYSGVPTSVLVARNPGPGTLTYETIVQPADLLEVDPESLVADIRWTAPLAGTYTVSGLFQGIDVGEGPHAVEVVLNDAAGSPLYSAVLAGYGQQEVFGFTQTVGAGDTIDFVVAYTGDYSNLSTGFDATISVPEANSAMWATAAMCVLAARRRGREGWAALGGFRLRGSGGVGRARFLRGC
jgi:hypothetical protein